MGTLAAHTSSRPRSPHSRPSSTSTPSTVFFWLLWFAAKQMLHLGEGDDRRVERFLIVRITCVPSDRRTATCMFEMPSSTPTATIFFQGSRRPWMYANFSVYFLLTLQNCCSILQTRLSLQLSAGARPPPPRPPLGGGGGGGGLRLVGGALLLEQLLGRVHPVGHEEGEERVPFSFSMLVPSGGSRSTRSSSSFESANCARRVCCDWACVVVADGEGRGGREGGREGDGVRRGRPPTGCRTCRSPRRCARQLLFELRHPVLSSSAKPA